jgi:hypothetical protein
MKGFLLRALLAGLFGPLLWGGLLAGTNPQPAAPADPPGGDPEAAKADHAFAMAVTNADQAGLGALLDAEFTWTDAAGKTFTRAQVLSHTPTPAITDESAAQIVERNYGGVEMVQAHNGRANIMRLWARRPSGWRLLVYQEATLLDGPAKPVTGTAATCDNPCKSLPYKPKNDNERDVLNGYMALQTATVYHNSEEWGKYVADEFSAASSNSNKVLDKKTRMADLERSKMAGYAPVPAVTIKLFDFGDTFILASLHQPLSGKPMHIIRLWNKRGGHWMEVASYQTQVQDAAAKP